MNAPYGSAYTGQNKYGAYKAGASLNGNFCYGVKALILEPGFLLLLNHSHDALCTVWNDAIELLKRPGRWQRTSPLG